MSVAASKVSYFSDLSSLFTIDFLRNKNPLYNVLRIPNKMAADYTAYKCQFLFQTTNKIKQCT